MTLNSKRTMVSIAVGIGLVMGYTVYVATGHVAADASLGTWAGMLLRFIGIGVAAQIVLEIVTRVAMSIGIAIKENMKDMNGSDDAKVERIVEAELCEDERDQFIGLKAGQIGYGFAGVALVAMLIALAMGASAVVALHVLCAGFALGSIAEGIASIMMYERGVQHG